jgi:small subunit ribosomal protein S18
MHLLLNKKKCKKILLSNSFQYLLLLNKFLSYKKYNKLKKKIKYINYTNILLLKNFLDEYGRILPYFYLNISTKYYKQITKAIKKARYYKLLPYII